MTGSIAKPACQPPTCRAEDLPPRRRILFVDDEPLVLRGLARQMRVLAREWDLLFVTSGLEAIATLEREPVDAVVTDMRMPGMTGAELLNTVMHRWPFTVRFILSGHADHEMIARCVGSTHQYLAKPCDPADLRNTLQSTLEFKTSLSNADVQRFVARLDRLPSVPALYHEIMAVVRKPDASLDEVGAVIARDIGMTAKVLQLVNSAFFGLAQHISDPVDAVAFLGIDTLRALVINLHAFTEFGEKEWGGFSLEALRRHSLEVASLARRIAVHLGAPRRVANDALAAGLLHDLGKIILATNFSKAYAEVRQAARGSGTALRHRETEAFGADHASLGAYLTSLWGLPDSVVQAIGYHHTPSEARTGGVSALTVVHLADAVIQQRETGAAKPEIDLQHLERLSISADLSELIQLADSPESPDP